MCPHMFVLGKNFKKEREEEENSTNFKIFSTITYSGTKKKQKKKYYTFD